MEERLQKYMASCGVASRRKCEELILDGKVKVNGALVNEVGIKIDPSKDKVEYDGKIISKEEKKVYIMHPFILLTKPCFLTFIESVGKIGCSPPRVAARAGMTAVIDITASVEKDEMCEPAYANLRFAVRRCFIFRLPFAYPYATTQCVIATG